MSKWNKSIIKLKINSTNKKKNRNRNQDKISKKNKQ